MKLLCVLFTVISFNLSLKAEIALSVHNAVTVQSNPVGSDNQVVSNPYSIKLFPNPTSSSFTISYTLKKQSTVKIILLDKDGRQLSSLKDVVQKSSDYKIDYNARLLHINKGVYFIKLVIDDESFIKSLVITG